MEYRQFILISHLFTEFQLVPQPVYLEILKSTSFQVEFLKSVLFLVYCTILISKS